MAQYTAKQRTEVLEMLRDGWNAAKVERATGVHRGTVRKWGRRAGVYVGHSAHRNLCSKATAHVEDN